MTSKRFRECWAKIFARSRDRPGSVRQDFSQHHREREARRLRKEQAILYRSWRSQLEPIFIATGKDPNQSLLRAKDIVTQARGGAVEFATLGEKFSEDELCKKQQCKLGAAIKIPELAPEVKTAVENVPVGSVTDPIKLENGYYIFRVGDEKIPRCYLSMTKR